MKHSNLINVLEEIAGYKFLNRASRTVLLRARDLIKQQQADYDELKSQFDILDEECDRLEAREHELETQIEKLERIEQCAGEVIKNQEAEIERYEKTVGKLCVNNDGIVTGLLNGAKTEYIEKSVANTFKAMAVNRAKTEAIKEFAALLHEKVYSTPTIYNAYFGKMVDDVAEELLEGK